MVIEARETFGSNIFREYSSLLIDVFGLLEIEPSLIMYMPLLPIGGELLALN